MAPSDWTSAFAAGADALLAAWRTQDADDPAKTQRISNQLAEFSVHTWDLARATGQPVRVDPEAATVGLRWAQENLKTEFRGDEASGKAFGPEVAIAADAPVGDRLAAWFGRDPAAW